MSLPSFFHMAWILRMCWATGATTPDRWLRSCTIARAIAQFVQVPSGVRKHCIPYVCTYFPPSDWCSSGHGSVSRSNWSGVRRNSLHGPVCTTFGGMGGA